MQSSFLPFAVYVHCFFYSTHNTLTHILIKILFVVWVLSPITHSIWLRVSTVGINDAVSCWLQSGPHYGRQWICFLRQKTYFMLSVNPDVFLQNHVLKLGIYIKLHVNLKYKLPSVSQCKRTKGALSKHFIISQIKETNIWLQLLCSVSVTCSIFPSFSPFDVGFY